MLVIPSARERGDWTEGAKGNQAYCVYTTYEISSSNSQLQGPSTIVEYVSQILNAFLLDFDFTSFFIGLTRNSHAFGFKLIRPVRIVTLKFND